MDELLLLENLTYLPSVPPFKSILDYAGKTVEEICNGINFDEIDEETEYGSFYNGFDWKNTIMAVRRNPRLTAAKIADTYIDEAYGGGGGIAALFINEE